MPSPHALKLSCLFPLPNNFLPPTAYHMLWRTKSSFSLRKILKQCFPETELSWYMPPNIHLPITKSKSTWKNTFILFMTSFCDNARNSFSEMWCKCNGSLIRWGCWVVTLSQWSASTHRVFGLCPGLYRTVALSLLPLMRNHVVANIAGDDANKVYVGHQRFPDVADLFLIAGLSANIQALSSQ